MNAVCINFLLFYWLLLDPDIKVNHKHKVKMHKLFSVYNVKTKCFKNTTVSLLWQNLVYLFKSEDTRGHWTTCLGSGVMCEDNKENINVKYYFISLKHTKTLLCKRCCGLVYDFNKNDTNCRLFLIIVYRLKDDVSRQLNTLVWV